VTGQGGGLMGNQRSRKWKLQRWQTIGAAVITAIATVIVALITAHGGSSSDSPASPAPSGLATATPYGLNPTVVVSSFSMTSFPPPPGERLSFSGIIEGFNYLRDPRHARVFILVCRSRATSICKRKHNWSVSSPAHAYDHNKWSIEWKLSSPPADLHWTAVLMTGNSADNLRMLGAVVCGNSEAAGIDPGVIGALNGYSKKQENHPKNSDDVRCNPPPSASSGPPSTAQFRSELKKSGSSADFVISTTSSLRSS